MPKITLLGAGSGFTQPLFTDIMSIPGLEQATLGLVDIDAGRLSVSEKLIRQVMKLKGKENWCLEVSTRREDVLPGTDYLINTIEVSGVECVRHDNDIPLKYGIDQCIGDTIGPGGIMKALRTAPVWVEILRDARKFCPDAMIMNYTNPMSIMSLVSVRSTVQPYIGLCHSVQGTSRHLAGLLGVPYEEMVWRCGGINHMAWFTELRHGRDDLYPELLSAMEDAEIYEQDPVRLEIMKEFGYFVTESSGHFSEYVPYFRKRREVREKYCRKDYLGGSSFYADNWPQWRIDADRHKSEMAAGRKEINLKRGHEYAADIVEAHLFDRAATVYGSVANTGLIPNLPLNGVVEVAVMVDRRGLTPTYFGPLPEQLAALCRSNMCVFELAAQGIIAENQEAIVQAMMLDPLSAAVCSPAEIRAMACELFAAEKEFIPAWASAPPVSRRRPVRKRAAKTPAADAAAAVSAMAARNVS